MFDISFFELLVVAGVGLIVIGPEKLPGTIKTCALWFGRIKQTLLDTRRDIEQQIGADEIRQQLRNEKIMSELAKLKQTRDQLERDIVEATQTGSTEALPHYSEDDAYQNDHDQYERDAYDDDEYDDHDDHHHDDEGTTHTCCDHDSTDSTTDEPAHQHHVGDDESTLAEVTDNSLAEELPSLADHPPDTTKNKR